MESMEACNARRLSNGMTRLEYYRSLNRDFTQEPRVYYGAFEKRVDIAYAAASARQKYDVYMPLNPGRYPTIVWIHGGGWFMGDRSDFAMGYLLPFIAHGYTVVSIGYRLAEEAVFPEPVYDVLEGLKHVLQRAEEFLEKQEMNYLSRIKVFQNRQKKSEDESEIRDLQRCIRECERILRRIKRNMEILIEEGTV